MNTIVRSFSRVVAAIVLAAAALVPAVASAPAAGATPPTRGNYVTLSVGAPGSLYASEITSSPRNQRMLFTAQGNGAIWYVNILSGSLGVLGTVGTASGIAVDPTDDSVWVGSNSLPGQITHLSSTGTELGTYPIPNGGVKSIHVTSDGRVWFTTLAGATDTVSYLDPTSSYSITEFTHPDLDAPTRLEPGPDGNLWFVNQGLPAGGWGHSVGKITPAGAITVYTDMRLQKPTGITAGSDGNLYVSNYNVSGTSSLMQVTTSGVFTEFTDANLQTTSDITTAGDGDIHILSSMGIVHFDPTTSTFSSTAVSPGLSGEAMALGADGTLWVPTFGTNEVVSIGLGLPEKPNIPQIYSPTRTTVSSPTDVAAIAMTGNGGSPITSWTLTASNGLQCTTTSLVSPCSITGLLEGISYTFTITYTNANGSSIASNPTSSMVAGGSGYTALSAPTRILDTRSGVGTTATDFTAGEHRSLVVAGVGSVPATATAVVINLGAVNASVASGGFAAVMPSATPFSPPAVSNINFASGRAYSNLATVQVGVGGAIDFFNKFGTTDLFADLVGYYDGSTGSTLLGTSPIRVFDTRTGTGTTATKLAAGEHRDFDIVSAVGLNPSTTAVALNVTANGATSRNAWLAVTPTPAGAWSTPSTSSLNLSSSSGAVANMVITGIGAGGKISIFNKNGDTNVIIDLVGVFVSDGSGSRFIPIRPTRALDTRDGTGGVSIAPLGTAASITFDPRGAGAIPDDQSVSAVMMNLTSARSSSTSWFGVYPDGAPHGRESSLNFQAGRATANHVLGALTATGFELYNDRGTADAIVDLSGYFVSAQLF